MKYRDITVDFVNGESIGFRTTMSNKEIISMVSNPANWRTAEPPKISSIIEHP